MLMIADSVRSDRRGLIPGARALGLALTFSLAGGDSASAQFAVRTLTGSAGPAEIQSLSDGTLTLASGESVPPGDWYSLRRSAGALPDWPDAPHAEFTGGDRVAGTVAAADGDALRLAVGFAERPNQVLRFPLSSLRAVWLVRRGDDAEPGWLRAPRKRDVFLSRNGDLATGALTAIEGTVLRYQADGRERQLALPAVAAIGFNTDLGRVRRPKGPYYRLTLADGTRLGALTVGYDGNLWTAQTLFKEAVRIPAEQVVSVDVEQGKVAYLSGLKPVKYQYQSAAGEDHGWVADRSVAGHPTRIKTREGESTFDRGLGLHAECTITYALGGKFRRFETLAGLDPRTGARGDAVLEVLVDGKPRELAGGGRLTVAGGPITVTVDVAGAKELTITVRRGNGGNVQDHVNLAEARLVP